MSETMSALFEQWLRFCRNRIRAASALSMAATVRDFEAFTGVVGANAVTSAQICAYRDHLILQRGLRAATVAKKISQLGVLLRIGIDAEMIDVNPVVGVTVRVPHSASATRLRYDMHDLDRIFSSPIYMRHERPIGGGGDAAAWLPPLALYSGGRLEQLGTRSVDDIEPRGDHWFIWFDDLNELNNLRRSRARRYVPIHTDLVEAGFLRFVERRRAEGSGRLFSLLTPNGYGVHTASFSKWWGRYTRTVIGITDPRKAFQSFRYTFRDAAHESCIDVGTIDELLGHARPSVVLVSRFDESALRSLAKSMNRLHFNGFRLPIIEE